ncbi:hypothetical protein BN12_340015 [Nostocoides japonicum T1-X7]|uniref:Uncharacterized protein n=1 Tax=Nostocoides japonicum T1-X7 TaxID=1194083 RepID=A0A077M3R1_9MICO|nr:hypothetical protein BN12_340015 [Tetrasphaera japonica T1-X7]
MPSGVRVRVPPRARCWRIVREPGPTASVRGGWGIVREAGPTASVRGGWGIVREAGPTASVRGGWRIGAVGWLSDYRATPEH